MGSTLRNKSRKRRSKSKSKKGRHQYKGGSNPAWLLPTSLQTLNFLYKPKSRRNKTRKRRNLLF